jgi:hypothetical protein
MDRGFIKLYRKSRDNPKMRNPNYFALWCWILLEANHTVRKQIFGGKVIECLPGQFTTGRKQLSDLSGIPESNIQKILSSMERDGLLSQQTSNTNRLISITNWDRYQKSNNKVTTKEQQSNTPEELKKLRIKEKENKTPEGFAYAPFKKIP